MLIVHLCYIYFIFPGLHNPQCHFCWQLCTLSRLQLHQQFDHRHWNVALRLMKHDKAKLLNYYVNMAQRCSKDSGGDAVGALPARPCDPFDPTTGWIQDLEEQCCCSVSHQILYWHTLWFWYLDGQAFVLVASWRCFCPLLLSCCQHRVAGFTSPCGAVAGCQNCHTLGSKRSRCFEAARPAGALFAVIISCLLPRMQWISYLNWIIASERSTPPQNPTKRCAARIGTPCGWSHVCHIPWHHQPTQIWFTIAPSHLFRASSTKISSSCWCCQLLCCTSYAA